MKIVKDRHLLYRVVLVGLMFLLGLYFLYSIRVILMPFFLGIILAYILNPIVTNLEKFNISRLISLLIVYITVLAAVFVAAVYGIPMVIRELNELAEAVPALIRDIQSTVNYFYTGLRASDIPESVRQVIDEIFQNAEQFIIDQIRQLADTLLALFSQVASVILAPILAFYLLKDWNSFGEKITAVLPDRFREDVVDLWHEIDSVLMSFIKGHLIVAAVVGILIALGLAFIGMDYVLLLSIIAGITDLIPYFGPIIGAIPAVVLALLESKRMAIYVLVVMVVVQQLESNVIAPMILGDSVGLHPLTIIFALLAGGHLFGIIGLLLAVPAAAVIRILFKFAHSKLV